MIANLLRRFRTRSVPLGIALVLLSALPGVAIASLPTHAPPSHACCMAPETMPPAANCDSSPCCIVKPAPRTFSVVTGDAAPVVLASSLLAALEPVLRQAPLSRPAPAPHARSAPLFVLFSTFLN